MSMLLPRSRMILGEAVEQVLGYGRWLHFNSGCQRTFKRDCTEKKALEKVCVDCRRS